MSLRWSYGELYLERVEQGLAPLELQRYAPRVVTERQRGTARQVSNILHIRLPFQCVQRPQGVLQGKY